MSQPPSDPRLPCSTRLTRLQLKNFKSVREADIAMGALTVIAGANSTGKSSVLQAILAMSQVTRRHMDGHRFPLNGEFARLGTFDTVRHQRADPAEPVRIAMRFASEVRDVLLNSAARRFVAERLIARPPHRESQPLDVHWAIELDSATEEQIGSAQISAIEVRSQGDGLAAAVRLQRTHTPSLVARQYYDLAEGLAFRGSIRSADSETVVLDALISSGQIEALFGTPPAASIRVHDWFCAIADQPRLERPVDAEPLVIPRRRVIQEVIWAVRQDVPADDDFADWYGRLSDEERVQVQHEVVEGLEAELRTRRRAGTGDAEPLGGRGPVHLDGAQRACARYLATQVRYVGPLRHAPHRPFPSAPDPDLGEVGVEGEYVASVLQANRGTPRHYPVPGGAVEKVPLLEAVRRWMVDFGLSDDLRVREDTPQMLGIDVVPYGLTRAVTLSAVGVGVSQVLPVIVQCLVAGPGALVVLEQPELHLHPAAQQRLADFLLACMAWGQNLLVESHSEYLVLRLRRRIAEDLTDRLRRDLVLLFASRDQDGETVYQPIELTPTGAMVEWPDGFFDQGPDEAHQLLIASAAKQRRTGANSGA
ncbi:MAG: DUF3696 domain-containing protein [Pseudonocardiaceae bacterium]